MMQSKKPSEIKYVFLTSFTFAFFIAFQIPIEIYLSNKKEIAFSSSEFIIYLFPGFLCFLSIFLIPAFIPIKFFQRIYFVILSTLMLLCWFTANFNFKNYGLFDGGIIDFDPFSLYGLLEVSFWILTLISVLFCNKSLLKILNNVVKFILVFCIISLFSNFYLSQNQNDIYNDSNDVYVERQSDEEFATFSSKKNIIHIVLDALQSTTFEKVLLEKPEITDQLTGFTFFPNTLANYSKTWIGFPALLTGKTHEDYDPINKFPTSSFNENSFWVNLENGGYKIGSHTYQSNCNNKFHKYCNTILHSLTMEQVFQFLDFSIFRISPIFLKERIYNGGTWFLVGSGNLAARGFGFLWRSIITISSSPIQISSQGTLFFQEFINNIKLGSTQPSYKMFHSLITHQPYILDETCSIIKLPKLIALNVLATKQAHCGIKSVLALIQKLKDLGIYDNSLIIISSDHGSVDSLPFDNIARHSEDIPDMHISYGLATLLIKPENGSGSMQRSAVPALLSDIPYTILSLSGENLIIHGLNIFDITEDLIRNRKYFFDERKQFNSGLETYFEHDLIQYNINGNVLNRKSWKKKSPPTILIEK